MKRKYFKFVELLVTTAILALLLYVGILAFDRIRKKPPYKLICGTHLKLLGIILKEYASEHDGRYPTPDKWCDIALNEEDVIVDVFFCKGSGESQNNLKVSHYAMNPKCGPNSPPDTVLIFETRRGWNKFGGPELLTTENHEGEGCNILFNNGSVKFIKTKQLGELKWDNKPKDEQKE